MAKITRITLTILLIVISVAAVGYYFWDQDNHEQTDSHLIKDFTKIDDYPLYTATYVGDYRFSEYLNTGTRPRLSGIGCTCFTVDGLLFGRNFDFPSNPALLLWTSPMGGYKSVSMVDLGYFGYSLENHPLDTTGLEETPYIPFDGMNEKGLVVAMAAIPYADAPESADKVSIGEIAVIRLLLDYAANVDAAVELLSEYNVEMTTPPIHYLIADPSGESVIIEFLDGEMKQYWSNEPQIMTNFLVTGVSLPEDSPCQRYDSVYSGIMDNEESMSVEYAFTLLETSSQSNTIWSTVYDMQNLTVHVAMGRDYSDIYSFELMKSDS